MKQKTISRIMIVGGVVAGLGIILVFGVFVPDFAWDCRVMYPELAYLYWPGLTGMWIIAAIILLALWEYFRVCVRIGREQSFSAGNVQSLRRIAVYMTVTAGLLIAAALLPGLVFQAGIGPLWVDFVILAMASFALSLLAWGLSLLLKRAVEIKEENDLTV